MHFILPCADAEHAAFQTMRGAFEYSGQKCSATSRVYVPDNLWQTFESSILNEHQNFNMGPVDGKYYLVITKIFLIILLLLSMKSHIKK